MSSLHPLESAESRCFALHFAVVSGASWLTRRPTAPLRVNLFDRCAYLVSQVVKEGSCHLISNRRFLPLVTLAESMATIRASTEYPESDEY